MFAMAFLISYLCDLKGINFYTEIKVRLFATLREQRGKELTVILSNSPTVKELIDSLGIKESQVAILLVNKLDAKISRQLQEKDTVSIFPPVRRRLIDVALSLYCLSNFYYHTFILIIFFI